MSGTQKSGFLDSLLDAIRPSNVFLKIAQFFFFGLITATPYLVKNLDAVASKAAGHSGFWAVGWAYMRALFGAMWKGAGIGLSTVFDSIIHFKDVISPLHLGTILYALMVMLFATLMIYQPMRLFFNIIDMKKGREHSRSTIMIISFVVMLVVASPFAYLTTGGSTITSGINEVVDAGTGVNQSINNTNHAATPEDDDGELSAVIDLVGG